MATKAATFWLQRHKAKKQRSSSLVELAAGEVADPIQRHKLENLVRNIGVQVAENLQPLLTTRFKSLPDNEINAALGAAADALDAADLTDADLFTADANSDDLARLVRGRSPDQARTAGLSEAATAVYEVALNQACRYLVQVVRYLPTFQSHALAETLHRLTHQAAQLEELLARIPRTSLYAPHGTDHDAEFTAAYLAHVSSALDRVELLGLSTHEQPRLALSIAYLSLNVSASRVVRPRGRRDRRADQWFSEQTTTAGSVRAEEAIGSADRTLVRGEAGSGKTTLLDWLAVTAARSQFTAGLADWNDHVPFPIRLRSFASDQLPTPEDFVRLVWPMRAAEMPPNWAHRRLTDGKCIVLVDGVDEVPAKRRRDVQTWLRDLARDFPNVKIVVTARPAAVDEKWLQDEEFAPVILEQMNADDIRVFVERWHSAASQARSLPCDRGELSQAEQRLLNQFASRPHLRTLAANPLLCAMLCALNLDHAAELPRNRMELYRRALAMLLDIRDTKRGVNSFLALAEKQALLRDIAWRLTLANRIELPKAKALEYVERKLPGLPNADKPADEVLTHLLERSGVLQQPVPGRVDFIHRTFQEYLAASEATEQGHVETLVGHAHLDTWRETVVMAAGHAKKQQADELLTEIMDRADNERRNARPLRLLAAACLETVTEVAPQVSARIESLIHEHLVPPRSVRETNSLASVGHRLLRYLPSTLENLTEAAAAATVRSAVLTGNVEALERLAAYSSDPRTAVQTQLISGWEYFDPQRYAEEVLADAPLLDGKLIVERPGFLAHLGALRHLDNLIVSFFLWRMSDLEVFADLPTLTSLSTRTEHQAIDVGPLAGLGRLQTIQLMSAYRYTNIESLAKLPDLARLTLFQACPWADLHFLRDHRQLGSLSLDALAEVRDYSPLDDLTHLNSLSLWEAAALASATGAAWPQVKDLSIMYNGTVTAARIKRCFPALRQLELRDTSVRTLGPLVDLPLRKLKIVDNDAPVDLRPLKDKKLVLWLSKLSAYRGLDELGPGVTVKYE